MTLSRPALIKSILVAVTLGAACAAPPAQDAADRVADGGRGPNQPDSATAQPPPSGTPDVSVAQEVAAPVGTADSATQDVADQAVPGPPADATAHEASDAGSSAPKAVLVYSHTTGNRHDSIPRAVAAVKKALADRGYTVEASEDPAWFTEARLRGLFAIVLVSTTGRQLGDPGTAALAAFEAWVRGGGILIGLHAASSSFYDPAGPYTRLIGGKFVEHPGGVRSGTCHKIGDHPAVAKLPTPFVTRDEIYVMSNVRPDNQLILTCDGVDGKKLPIAWHRQEGSGRVFYTALGHLDTDFAPDAPYFRDHALPGMLWALMK